MLFPTLTHSSLAIVSLARPTDTGHAPGDMLYSIAPAHIQMQTPWTVACIPRITVHGHRTPLKCMLVCHFGDAKWNGEARPQIGDLGAGAVGMGGCAWLRWLVARLWCVSSARLRWARALWTIAGRPPGSDVRRRNQSSPLAQRSRCGSTTEHGIESRLPFITPVNSLYHISFYVLARV